jgi:hypothetical protein
MRVAPPPPRRALLLEWGGLAFLVLASIVVRAIAGSRLPGLWIAPDEMIYGILGRNVYEVGRLAILPDGPTEIYSVVYPVLIGLPLAALDTDAGYAVAKVVGAVTMSATAVPVYLWARSLATRGWAFVAAAATLALPGLVYTGLLMTEVAFAPIVVVVAWLTALVLVAPSRTRQALLVGAVLVAVATRLQAVALVPAIATAAVLYGLFERRPRLALRVWPALAAFAALAAAWAGWRLRHGGPWTKVLGSYAAAGESGYDVGDAAKWIVFHLADVALLVALFPLCALFLLAIDVVRGRERDPAVRAYVAVAVAVVAWFAIEVGVFASRHVGRLAERDLIPLAPVLLIGFSVFLHRGALRPRVATAVVVLVVAAAVLALPVTELFTKNQIPDAPTTVPFVLLGERSERALELAFYLGIGYALVAFAVWPRRWARALAVPVIAALALASIVSTRSFAENARYDQQQLLGGQRDWIDEAVDAPVAYVYSGEGYWNGVWQQVFWNTSIGRVYFLGDDRVPGPLPQERVSVGADGRLMRTDGTPVDAGFVAAPVDTDVYGERVAEVEQHNLPDQRGLAVARVRQPLRLGSILDGVRWNGDMHEPAKLRVFACEGGTLFLTLLQKESKRVEIYHNGRLVAVPTFDADGVWNGQLTAEPGPHRTCTFEVRPDSFLGSTQFRFVRS